MTGAQLLLVDDNPDNLHVLAVILGERHRVLSYARAPEALQALDTTSVDLLLLDIAMGPLDGLECLRAVRARPGYQHVPAIALTAHAREVDRAAFLAAGFQAVITKPILDFNELFQTVDRLLASSSTAPVAPGKWVA